MARVMKCDRCGATYKTNVKGYFSEKHNNPETELIQIIIRGKCNYYELIDTYDLCDDCLMKLKEFFKETKE